MINFERIRKFLDGETEDKVPDGIEAARQKMSLSETFLKKLVDAVDANLRDEITRIPNTRKAYVPSRYKVFVDEAEFNSLRSDKRQFFEQGLGAVVLDRAREMTHGLELTSQNIAVEIAVDATLGAGEIYVVAMSEDRARTVANFDIPPLASPELPKTVASIDPVQMGTDFGGSPSAAAVNSGTLEDFEDLGGILYRVEITQGGKSVGEVPVIVPRITIGRDDADKVANIRLVSENRKISREHAEISVESGEIWVTAKHRNPTVVSGKVIRDGERARLQPDGEIQIYDFVLKIKLTIDL